MTSGILIVSEDMFRRLDLEDKIEKIGDFEMSRKGLMGNPLPLIGDPVNRVIGGVKNEAKKYGAHVVVITGEMYTTNDGFSHQYTAEGYYCKFRADIDEAELGYEAHEYFSKSVFFNPL